MGRGGDEDFVGCFEGGGKAREQVGEGRLEPNRGEDAGAEHGVAGKSVEKGVVGSGQVEGGRGEESGGIIVVSSCARPPQCQGRLAGRPRGGAGIGEVSGMGRMR